MQNNEKKKKIIIIIIVIVVVVVVDISVQYPIHFFIGNFDFASTACWSSQPNCATVFGCQTLLAKSNNQI